MGKFYLVTPEPNSWESKVSFTPDKFYWDDISISKKIDTRYKLKIHHSKIKKIDVDYFNYSSPIGSSKLRDLFEKNNVNAQFVSIDVFNGKDDLINAFYFILLNDFLSIVNHEKSNVVWMHDRNTNLPLFEPNFPEIPVFEKVENLVLKTNPTSNFFMAPELGGRVCSEHLKNEIESANIKGIKFTELDENFKYDPYSFLR